MPGSWSFWGCTCTSCTRESTLAYAWGTYLYIDILRRRCKVHVHVHESKPVFSVNTHGKHAAVQSQCRGWRMHRYLTRVLAVRQADILRCKPSFMFMNMIPEQISLHVHDRAWFLEQCMSSRPAPHRASSPTHASCPY